MENLIKDYGTTVSPQVYINALQGHQYIPQSDQCIRNLINQYNKNKGFSMILDVGCGPGRLTSTVLSHNTRGHVEGIDISPAFIRYAKMNKRAYVSNVGFRAGDFVKEDIFTTEGRWANDYWNIIFMQGVMHHIHGEDRAGFFKRSFDLLRKDGILIIGDEFIREYNSEEERKLRVANFYLHIIAEAIKGGFSELAHEEAKNLVDDVLSGEDGAGFANEEIFEYIYDFATKANDTLYKIGSLWGSDIAKPLIEKLRHNCKSLSETKTENFNRGDYKVSIPVFVQEAEQYGFKLDEMYKIGPVDQLGGMGVLVFTKG